VVGRELRTASPNGEDHLGGEGGLTAFLNPQPGMIEIGFWSLIAAMMDLGLQWVNRVLFRMSYILMEVQGSSFPETLISHNIRWRMPARKNLKRRILVQRYK
jgi:hypothetical protein